MRTDSLDFSGFFRAEPPNLVHGYARVKTAEMALI
jgi:hypothetical protein